MSATTARATGPSTADAAPLEAMEVNEAAESEVGEQAVGEVAEREGETAPAVDAEEAEHRHKALTVARIRLSRAPGALKERFAALAEEAKDAAAAEACLKAVEESLP